LQVLAMRALVWPDGAELRMAGPLWSVFGYPLRLGPPLHRLLCARSADELRRMALTLGVPAGRTKQAMADQLAARLGNPDQVRAVVAHAEQEVVELLHEIAWHGPAIRSTEIIFGYGHSADPRLDWALSRGLLVADGWQAAVMPREIGRALRGPDWYPPFHPYPPEPPLTRTEPAAVATEAAAAAGPAVAQLTALLEVCATTPPTLLKAGGLGARELKRLAKAVGVGEPEVRLLLEIGSAAGLLAVAKEQLLPTASYDQWRVGEPADRLIPMLRAWWQLAAAPASGGALTSAALLRSPYGDVLVELRQELVRVLADLPAGQGLATGSALPALIGWRAPLLLGAVEEAEELLAAVWREALRLGVVAHGALTPLGAALLDGSFEVVRELLPAALGNALFQADLSAVVPGTPTAALSALLDTAADREVRDGAAIWRFSSGSVRRALDAGTAPDELLAALRAVATGGTLPQPLEYLVADVARRHGRLRVRSVAVVLRADDPPLLAEIAAARALVPLGLVLLAPTVLASGAPAGETLAALRAAGYAPVREDADGSTVVERVPVRRASASSRRRSVAKAPALAKAFDKAELAAALLAAPPEPVSIPGQRTAGPDPDDPDAVISAYAPQLSAGEQRMLSYAVSHGTRVQIQYTNAEGNPSARVIEPLGVYGHLVEAWCHLRDEERMFALDRIDAVGPAD
jgi:hypothetical protein